MTTVTLGALSTRSPEWGPFIVGIQGGALDIRLGYDAALSEPILVGAIPQAKVGADDALAHTRYALWQRMGRQPDNSCTTVMTVDVEWSLYPDPVWLIFLVYAQPLAVRTIIENHGAHPDDVKAVIEQSEHLRPRFNLKPPLESTFVDLPQAATRLAWKYAQPLGSLTESLTNSIQAADIAARGNHRAPWDAYTPITGPAALPQPPKLTRFVLSSCQYPASLFDCTPAGGSWAASPPDQSLARLAALRQIPARRPEFILMVGDQVYLDATAGFFDPTAASDHYDAPYQQWLSRPATRSALSNLPIHAMLDDHEIADNWAPVDQRAQGVGGDGVAMDVQNGLDELLKEGLRYYGIFQCQATHEADQGPPVSHPKIWRTVGTPSQPELVFLADTRTERDLRNTTTIEQAAIMSALQFEALTTWLIEGKNAGPRFLACPSLVLPRKRKAVGATPASALNSDAWDGYPSSLHRLLAALCTHQLSNTVLLSGDEHLASISVIDIQQKGAPLATRCYVVHTPGLYAPFPFSNAKPGDFQTAGERIDTFDFIWPDEANPDALHTYLCEVKTWFPGAADGFVVIEAPPDLGDGQKIGVTFSLGASGQAPSSVPRWLRESATLEVTIEHANTPPPTE